jgi:hypothetical protein
MHRNNSKERAESGSPMSGHKAGQRYSTHPKGMRGPKNRYMQLFVTMISACGRHINQAVKRGKRKKKASRLRPTVTF